MTSARKPFPCLIGFHKWKIGKIVGREYENHRFEYERSACPKHTVWEVEDRFDRNDPLFGSSSDARICVEFGSVC
jgi:hypothetical protein